MSRNQPEITTKSSGKVRLGRVWFDVATGELRDADNRVIELRRQSGEVLSVLAQRPMEMVRKEDLMEAIWADVAVTDDSLVQCIADIRRTVLFAAGLASYAYLTPGSTPQPPPQELPVVTVLPFANANDDPEQQYFIDGLTEDLTTDLSRVSGLRMISRASSFAFKDSKATPREIAQELGAGFVVSGSVRRDNRRLMAACFSSAGSQ